MEEMLLGVATASFSIPHSQHHLQRCGAVGGHLIERLLAGFERPFDGPWGQVDSADVTSLSERWRSGGIPNDIATRCSFRMPVTKSISVARPFSVAKFAAKVAPICRAILRHTSFTSSTSTSHTPERAAVNKGLSQATKGKGDRVDFSGH